MPRLRLAHGGTLESGPQFTGRSRRVQFLLAGVVLLSLADLVITLQHLRTFGMAEANPLAAWLIRTTDSACALAVYKGITVGLCVMLLYRLRRHASSEFGAWCAMLILAGMSLLWHSYSEALASPAELQLMLEESNEAWLRLE